MPYQRMFIKIFFIFFLSSISFFSVEAKFFDCQFKRNLSLGLRGNDVICLQQYLFENKFLKSKITGIYDFKTRKAVKIWQELNKIYPANGNFETSSRVFLNRLFLLNQVIKDSVEIKINLDEIKGIKDIETYFENIFVDISPEVTSTTLASLFRLNEPFSLVYLINETVNNQGNVNQQIIKQKNQIFQDFFSQRIKRLQDLKVSSRFKNLHLAISLSDLFSLKLSEKFNNYLDDKISQSEFYSELEDFELRLDIIKKMYVDPFFAGQTKKTENKFLSSANRIFFENKIWQNIFFKQAQAFGNVLFGGRIKRIIWCPCSGFARVVHVGPPVPASLFIPPGFEATPAVFMWKNLYTQDVWLLGMALPTKLPCLDFKPHAPCYPLDWGSPILMVGTSLTP